MGGLFSRLKTWIDSENLTDEDLNAEFDNIINNLTPTYFDDHSSNQTQMETTADPYPSNTPSLATSLAGELERIRYQIKQITGEDQWYKDPRRSLGTSGAELAVVLTMESDNDLYRRGVIGDVFGFSGSVNVSSNQAKFGSKSLQFDPAQNIAAVSDVPVNFENGISFGGWFYNANPGDYLVFHPVAGIEVFVNNSGNLQVRITEATAATVVDESDVTISGAKKQTSVTGSSTISALSSWTHFLVCIKSNKVEMFVNGTEEGTEISSTLNINYPESAYFILGGKKTDPSEWDLLTAFDDADPAGWTKTGTSGTVSNGVLTITTANSTAHHYASTASGWDIQSFTAEMKLKVDSVSGLSGGTRSNISFQLIDNSKSRSFRVIFNPDSLLIQDASGSGTETVIPVSATSWHTYRFVGTSSGSDAIISVFVDGVFLSNVTLATSHAPGADVLKFGHDSSSDGAASSQWEYVGFYTGSGTAPVDENTATGYIDDFFILNKYLDSSSNSDAQVITGLQTYSARDVFLADPLFVGERRLLNRQGALENFTTSSVTFTDTGISTAFNSAKAQSWLVIATGTMSVDNASAEVYLALEDANTANDVNGISGVTASGVVDSGYYVKRYLPASTTAVVDFTIMKVFSRNNLFIEPTLYAAEGNVAHTLTIYRKHCNIVAIPIGI